MLSHLDIEKELGKGINIVPFNSDNLKENSINLCTSKMAWTLSSGTIYYDGEYNLSSRNNTKKTLTQRKFSKGGSAVLGDYIVLLPFSTTLIETKEVLGIANYIGGTYHSKVSMVSIGIGHIGTMLGPNFNGHSLIALHNISPDPIKLKIGESFVSIVFHKLDTPIVTNNATENAHLSRLTSYGVHPTKDEIDYLDKDWKKKFDSIQDGMLEDKNFIAFQKHIKSNKHKRFKRFLKPTILIPTLIALCIILVLGIYSIKTFIETKDSTLLEIYSSVFLASIFSCCLTFFLSKINSR